MVTESACAVSWVVLREIVPCVEIFAEEIAWHPRDGDVGVEMLAEGIVHLILHLAPCIDVAPFVIGIHVVLGIETDLKTVDSIVWEVETAVAVMVEFGCGSHAPVVVNAHIAIRSEGCEDGEATTDEVVFGIGLLVVGACADTYTLDEIESCLDAASLQDCALD